MKTCSNKDCTIEGPQELSEFYFDKKLGENRRVAQCRTCLLAKQKKRNDKKKEIKSEVNAITTQDKQATHETESMLNAIAKLSTRRIEQYHAY